MAGEAWVVDGSYRGKLGDLVLEAADTVVWLDLPRRVWLPRLLRRTVRRIVLREELWNGNRESLRGVLLGPGSLLGYALRTAPRRRQRYPRELARFRVAPAPLARPRSKPSSGRRAASAGDRQRSRERSSATHAAARSPSQMGVRTT